MVDDRAKAGRTLLGLKVKRSGPTTSSPGSGRIAIHRDPLAAPFHREGGIPSVGDTRAANICLRAQTPEDVPVPWTGLDDLAIWLSKDGVAESKCFITRTGGRLQPMARGYPDQRGQCQGEVANGDRSKRPPQASFGTKTVFRGIFSKGVDKDVNVGEDHRKPRLRRSM